MARLADLLSVEEAQERILSRFQTLAPETCDIQGALGRVLAESVASNMSLPPFDNSSMDGFALRASDTVTASAIQPVLLKVIQSVAAGSQSTLAVTSGACARIMTGAPVPMGADTVVPFEDVEERDNVIVLREPIPVSSCIRPAGNDLTAGTEVLERGADIGSRQVGMLAAIGRHTVSVTRRPMIAVLSTGDELVEPGQPLRRGQIYNSNTPMLAAAVTEAGGLPRVMDAVGDTVKGLTDALDAARQTGVDLIVTSGGASVGDFDHVKDVLQERGTISFWRVRVRPGKPLILGELGGISIVGLPGNPTSAMVTFELFVRPAIRRMLGGEVHRPRVNVVADDYIDNRGGRRTYARVVLTPRDGKLHARISGPQDSAMLRPLARANALLVIPEDQDAVHPGSTATALLWS